jgi:serine/threonine protein kinase/Flp pilus assembly protein TadD
MQPGASVVESILAAAVEISSEAQRRQFVEQACAGDPELQRRVEALIENHFLAGNFLESPAGASPPTINQPIAERPGTAVGPYKLLEQIGEGGFGVVFMAEQQEPIRRKVALKVLKPGMDSRQVIARFEAERQALALMDHPNIARVLDAGTIDSEPLTIVRGSGRPYFVMELVKGVPITDYCDQNRLPPRERLELFVHVCQAVQHAHQKGIIHRDIKPSNVLVTLQDSKPLVKVIDFGIAKALGQQLTDKTLFTGFAQLIGTPLYMSPEQAALSNVDVDTRSDIYSLGVLLYELLTGTTPFDKDRLKEVGFDELRRIIREEEPVKPSTRISTLGQAASTVSGNRQSDPARLSRLFRGELDWIVMKALEKDRNRRYETASAFAGDVERYLKDEPVLACPPSAWYRLRKFARRNKTRLVMGGLALFFLLLLVGGGGWVARDKEARRAHLEQQCARALDEALDFCQRDQVPEALVALRAAESMLASGEGSAELRQRASQAREDVQMAARLEEIRLEKAAVKLGDFDYAGAEPRYHDAFRSYGLDVPALDVDQAAAEIRASAIRNHLVSGLDDWVLVKPPRPAGTAVGDHLLAVLQRADTDPWRSRLRDTMQRGDLKALIGLARDQAALAQPPATAFLLGKLLGWLGQRGLAIDVLRRAQERHPNDFWINHDLGYWLMQEEPVQADEAVGYFRAALALRPSSPGVMTHLGNALRARGDLPGAIFAYKEAIALNADLAVAHENLGIALYDKGDLAGAVAALQKAVALQPDRSAIHSNLGIALHAKGDLEGAIAAQRRAVAQDPRSAMAQNNLGGALVAKGDLSGAATALDKAIALKPKYAEAYCNRGQLLKAQGDLPGALAAVRKAIAFKPGFAEAHYNLGIVLVAMDDRAGASTAYKKAIALKPTYVEAHYNLGNTLKAMGDLAGAVTAYHKTIALRADFAEAHCNLGLTLQQQGELRKALKALHRGHELGSKNPRWRYPSARWLEECQRLLEAQDDGR